MSNDEIAYFTARANQEFAAARRAQHASAAMAHLILAELYVDAIYAGISTAPMRRMVPAPSQGAVAI